MMTKEIKKEQEKNRVKVKRCIKMNDTEWTEYILTIPRGFNIDEDLRGIIKQETANRKLKK